MTEAEWLACSDPERLISRARRDMSNRRARLLACAFGRVMGRQVGCEAIVGAVEVAERWADGQATGDEAILAWDELWEVYQESDRRRDHDTALAQALTLPCLHEGEPLLLLMKGGQPDPRGVRAHFRKLSGMVRRWLGVTPDERPRIEYPLEWPGIVRCVTGNPFRPVTPDPTWRTSTVAALAQQMYDSRDFSPMPILGDAMGDAGCEDTAVLAHCRGDGHHVRGCWVVDLILGKQ